MTAPAAGFETNLLNGMAAGLQTAGIGTWRTSGAYAAGETGIVIGDFTSAPDAQIALDTYGVADHYSLSTSVIGLQVRCRWGGGDPRPAKDLAALIFDLWHGSQHLVVGTGAAAVHIVKCERSSGPASLGRDTNNRWANVQNFYCTCRRPSSNRT